MNLKVVGIGALTSVFCATIGCNGSNADREDIAVEKLYSIGGEVTGLQIGQRVILQYNDESLITLERDGHYRFPEMVPNGTAYKVKITESPDSSVCNVENGEGTLQSSDIDNIYVRCVHKKTWSQVNEVFPSVQNTDVQSHKIATDGTGRSILIWLQRDNLISTYSLWSSAYSFDSGWEIPQSIESLDASVDSFDIEMNSSGHAIAVWEQYSGAARKVWASSYSDVSGWIGGVEISGSAQGNDYRASVEIDDSGRALVVWDKAISVWYNQYDKVSGWAGSELLDEGGRGSYSEFVKLGSDSQGNVVITWRSNESGVSTIWARRYINNVGWEERFLVYRANSNQLGNPEIAVSSNGNAIILWTNSFNDATTLRYRYFDFERGWSEVDVVSENANGLSNPSVSFKDGQSIFLVWQSNNGISETIRSRMYNRDSGWSPSQLLNNLAGNAISPKVVSDIFGNAMCVWMQYDGFRFNIWSSYYSSNTKWGEPELIEFDSGEARDPVFIFNNDGSGMAVWTQISGYQDSLRYRNFR